jgi:atypical dual specificity phosphatase
MCREYAGPIAAYKQNGIEQLHIPTPDICEPEYIAMLQGIQHARLFLLQNKDNSKKVFVHCKAGRGRSAAFTLCLLVALGMNAEEAMALLLSRRNVVEAHVFNYRVVRRLVLELNTHSGGFDALCNAHRISA